MKLFNLLALAALTLTVGTSAALAADTAKAPPPPKHDGGKMFDKLDTNKDGSITKAESAAFHDAKFMEMDANKDGKVTKEEMKAHHEAKKAEWEAKKDAVKSK